MVTRDERQEESIQKWINNKCHGTLELPTGFGKTRVALKIIKKFLDKNPGKQVLVVVPTQELKNQWTKHIDDWGYFMCTEVIIINSLVKTTRDPDLLIIDECHRFLAPQFFQLFSCVKYRMILGLTATLERLDNKHLMINKYCPIVDKFTAEEAINNGWLAPYKEYVVYIEADLDYYNEVNKLFLEHFAWFDYNFEAAMKAATDYKFRNEFVKERANGDDTYSKQTIYHAMGFTQTLSERKEFIYNHPKKIEITNKILSYRKGCKAITFSPTTQVAESLDGGVVLHSKKTKKAREKIMNDFASLPEGCIHTAKALDEGADIPGLNLAIILSTNSSKLNKIQRLGRIIRFSPNKKAELFTLVIKNTVDEQWYRNSNTNEKHIPLNESQLDNLLTGKEVQSLPIKKVNMKFRF